MSKTLINNKKNSLRVDNVKDKFLDLFLLLIGCFIMALYVNCFINPNNIGAGGVVGVSQIFEHLFGFSIGITGIILNIPIFLWAFFEFGVKKSIKNAVTTFLFFIIVDVTKDFLPIYRGESLLVAILGGVTAGLGSALIFYRGTSTGGTDLLALLVQRYFRYVKIGELLFIIDGVIITISAIVHSFGSKDSYAIVNNLVYSSIFLFVQSVVVDNILYGISDSTGKIMFIVSEKSEEISKTILSRVKRGITALRSRGVYSSKNGEVLLVAVKRQEVHKIYSIIKSIDKNSFIIVGEAREITGEGFKEID